MANANINLIIKAKDEASAKLRNVSSSLSNTNSKLNKFAQSAMRVTAIAGGLATAIGVKAARASMDFEKSMTNIATLVDTNTESMAQMGNEVKELAMRTPVAMADLTSALYDVRSAGVSAEGAMTTLEQSARLATAGLGTTKEATNLVTSAINAFGIDARNSESIANTFFMAVKSGKTTIAELAQGFGQVAPLASQVGMKLEEVSAITAAMTTTGMRAAEVWTAQKAIISNLLKPTAEMTELMKLANITDIEAQISKEGLISTIRTLTDAADGNTEAISKAFGSVEGLNVVMGLNNELGEDAIKIMGDMTEEEDALKEAFDKQNETSSAQWQILKNKLNVAMISLGDIILPNVIRWLNILMSEGKPIMEGLADRAWILYNRFGDLSGSVSDLVYGAWNDFLGKTKDVISAVKTAIEWIGKLKDKADSWIGKAADKVNDLFDEMKSFRGFQHGGAVTAGRPVVVGEHRPEVFVPSQSGNIRQVGQAGGMKDVTVNFNNPVVRSDADLQRIVEAVKNTLNQEQEYNAIGAR